MEYKFNKVNFIFGEIIREHRKGRGMIQYELGERAGLSANAISTLENGQGGMNLQTLDRLAEALGVRSSYLLGLRDAAMEAQEAGASRPQVKVVKALGDAPPPEGMFAEDAPESQRPAAPGDPRDAQEMITWVADGLLPGYKLDVVAMVGSDGVIYPLPTESAAMANILETTLVKHLEEAAKSYEGVEPERPSSDRVYPDIAFTGPALGGKVVACDIKAARRKEAKRARAKTQTQSRISLYTGNTYFRNPESNTQNIERPFNDYALHLDIVVLYDFVKDPQPAVTNVELVVVEPWRIASRSRSSNTRKYIGAVTRLSDIEQGKGEFDTKEEFYTYWRSYEW